CQEAERQKLEVIACGMPENQPDCRFALHYLSSKRLKKEEVRELFVNCVEDFLDRVNGDEKICSQLTTSPITIAHLNFNISFANIEGQFREPPYIAYAFLKNGKICYCYYDNLFGKFIEYNDVEEDYEMAKKIIRGRDEA